MLVLKLSSCSTRPKLACLIKYKISSNILYYGDIYLFERGVFPSPEFQSFRVDVLSIWHAKQLRIFQQDKESDEVLVKSSFLAELQRRVLKAEAALREKEEENDILHQRLQQYENRWSEYELKMKSMEEVWQKQMRSLQSSLSIAKKSLAMDDSRRNSDASVNLTDDRDSSWDTGSNFRGQESNGMRPMSAGLTVISRMAEEFEQRSQVFGDDAKFLVEVKSGQTEASLNPDRELRRLKQMFEAWKKDYGSRLRETKVILQKLGNEEGSGDKARKKWWVRRNSSRFN